MADPALAGTDSRPPNPEKDGLGLLKKRRELVADVLYARAQRTGSGGSPSWWTPHWRAWYRDGADEICAALEANDAEEVTRLRSELAALREANREVAETIEWARESRSLNGEEGAHG